MPRVPVRACSTSISTSGSDLFTQAGPQSFHGPPEKVARIRAGFESREESHRYLSAADADRTRGRFPFRVQVSDMVPSSGGTPHTRNRSATDAGGRPTHSDAYGVTRTLRGDGVTVSPCTRLLRQREN